MKIVSAKYVTTAVQRTQYPPPQYPEIAFAGRSNVGKSTLISTLTNRRKLVKISSTPGKTRTINFFLINEEWMFVDLPGYGYAKVPLEVRKSWRPMVETYLTVRENLAAVVLIMDFRRPPTDYDKQMAEWLRYHEVSGIMVATKVDKVARGSRRDRLHEYAEVLGAEEDQIIIFSGSTGEGRDRLWHRIRELASPDRKI